jgi:hypothetical protein
MSEITERCPSCGSCKHYDGQKKWGDCTAPVPPWAYGEYIDTHRQVFCDGGPLDRGSECEVYRIKVRDAQEEEK